MMDSNTNFRYVIGGKLEPIDDPTAGRPDNEDIDDSMSRIGFLTMLTLGDKDGLSMTIYGDKDAVPRWFLAPGDCCSTCLIEVQGWPAYLDALARYAPIYSAPVSD